MPKGIPKHTKIDAKCPPVLARLIAQEGSMTGAAKAAKAGNYTINRIARGIIPMTSNLEFKIAGAIKGGNPIQDHDEQPATIPPWDGKLITHKVKKKDGSTTTFKKFPAELAEVLARNNGVMGQAARAMGYSGWSGIPALLESGSYAVKVHPRAYAALNGLPLPTNGKALAEDVSDSFSTGMAICFVSLSEYERLEDLADVMGGTLVVKMSAGPVWIVIYRIAQRDKLEKFKKLARRDAKRIVCP